MVERYLLYGRFQHALHTIEAVKAGCDAYVKNHCRNNGGQRGIETVKHRQIIQIDHSEEAHNYHAANEFIRSGKSSY